MLAITSWPDLEVEMSQLPATADVVVAGAGPTGLTLAAFLTAGGADVVLLDKAAEGAGTSRAAVVHARTLEVLEGLDVTAELVKRGLITPTFTVRDRDRVLHPDAADVQALLDGRGPRSAPASVRDVGWSSRFRVHHRIAGHYRAGRIFLAGDAAHVHSPAGGQGMNIGIQDAAELARRILDGTQDGYEAARRPVAAGVVAMTDRMTRAATVRNPVARAVRNTALAVAGRRGSVRRRLAMRLSELSTDR
jgi:2-polyprenyl-6-methoxyphenol hydroxylase-like FAD-dependent oxidoreductase